MKEIQQIISVYDTIKPLNVAAALATVVRVEGSSYRRTGARMLVQEDGQWTGGISGGCLEGDALKRARAAIFRGIPSLITYDTTQDDEHQIGVGLGCNGIIDVLFTPLDYANPDNPVELLKQSQAEGRKTHTLLTVTQLKGSIKNLTTGDSLLYADITSLKNRGDAEFREAIKQAVEKQQTIGHSAPVKLRTADAEVTIFIELLPPAIHLLIFGHQYDVFPLCRLTKELGWETTVVAPPLKVNPAVRALATKCVSPEAADELPVDAFTAAVLMSHDFEKDKQHLAEVVQRPFPYIGMLGPRVRSERIWRELADEGFSIPAETMQRIYAPVGLDIGAVSPEEIALSLVSEIRAVFSGRSGGSLRLRQQPIHERQL